MEITNMRSDWMSAASFVLGIIIQLRHSNKPHPHSKMAASDSKVGGYTCEFIDEVSVEFLLCKECSHVAKEPHIATCCGETFCQVCIEDRRPCPSCGEEEFTVALQSKYKQKILSYRVYCTMKERGCKWSGKLEGLDVHLDACQFIDVPCPDCDQQIQKCEVATHLANACPKRDYNCRYCGFSGTYEVICNDHWPECEQYPIPCPNYCGLSAIERCSLEHHSKLCPRQEVECDFSHAGCSGIFLRRDLEKHMEENVQQHLVLMSAAMLRTSQEFEKKLREQSSTLQREFEEKLQEQRHEYEEKLHQLRERDQQIREETNKQITEQLQLKDQQIHGAEAEITSLKEDLYQKQLWIDNFAQHASIPPFRFSVSSIQLKVTQLSPPIYTHIGGYKLRIGVYPKGDESRGTYVAVNLWVQTGEFDDKLKWPAKCAVTLQLLNRHRDQDHVTVTKEFELKKAKNTYEFGGWFSDSFIAHKDLQWNVKRQTQYLKDKCLQFRVVQVKLYK